MIGTSIRLVRVLGEGGMGSVWVADHLTLQTQVAVKFMSQSLMASEDAVIRFSREATAAAQVKSPHVVQMFDHGLTPEGIPYIVMELLEGEDLGKRLAAAEPLQGGGQRWGVRSELAAIGRKHGIGPQPFLVVAHCLAQVGAADFLFAFEDELHVDWRSSTVRLGSYDRLLSLVDDLSTRPADASLSRRYVVTLGRATQPGDVFSWQGPTVEVSRGGRATYHGPNQIVSYPILNLERRGRDLHKYMRDLETAIVRTLKTFGIEAAGRADASIEATGVWLGERKLASIGIGVRKWVSYHGLALNVSHDPKAFRGMKPCGFSTDTMLSMEEVLGQPVDKFAVQEELTRQLVSILC